LTGLAVKATGRWSDNSLMSTGPPSTPWSTGPAPRFGAPPPPYQPPTGAQHANNAPVARAARGDEVGVLGQVVGGVFALLGGLMTLSCLYWLAVGVAGNYGGHFVGYVLVIVGAFALLSLLIGIGLLRKQAAARAIGMAVLGLSLLAWLTAAGGGRNLVFSGALLAMLIIDAATTRRR
jgi:hypothetical protein